MFLILGICITLASLFILNALASLVTALVWQVIKRPARYCTAATRAATLFVLRMSPPAISLVCVTTLLLPAYIKHEPRASEEVVGFKLLLLAVVSCIGLGLAIWRGLAAWRATRRITSDWLRHAEPITLPGVSAPVFLLHHRFPIIAVVGVLRPRMFIAGQVFEALNTEEIAAAVAHEYGHIHTHDNLKRALLRVCHDALTIVPWGRSLDREWARTAEGAADEYASRAGMSVALDLAAALVKIARLAPSSAMPMLPAGTFLLGGDEGGVEWRVRRLLKLATAGSGVNRLDALLPRTIIWCGLCMAALLPVAIIATASPQVFATTHAALEFVVAILS